MSVVTRGEAVISDELLPVEEDLCLEPTGTAGIARAGKDFNCEDLRRSECKPETWDDGSMAYIFFEEFTVTTGTAKTWKSEFENSLERIYARSTNDSNGTRQLPLIAGLIILYSMTEGA
jgi:hypothetical protein